MKKPTMPLAEIMKAFGEDNVADVGWEGAWSKQMLVDAKGRRFELEVRVAFECACCHSFHTGDCIASIRDEFKRIATTLEER